VKRRANDEAILREAKSGIRGEGGSGSSQGKEPLTELGEQLNVRPNQAPERRGIAKTLGILLYTGQRRSDVILSGPQHVKDGWLCFTQQKNRNSKPVTLEIPILPQLTEILVASKSGI
jgi:hypothetical protein